MLEKVKRSSSPNTLLKESSVSRNSTLKTDRTMNSSDFFTSACRHCRHYCPEGRRGGHCNRLNVSVQGSWKACSLAIPIFEPVWDLPVIPVWHSKEVSEEVIASNTPTVQPVEITHSSY